MPQSMVMSSVLMAGIRDQELLVLLVLFLTFVNMGSLLFRCVLVSLSVQRRSRHRREMDLISCITVAVAVGYLD